MATYSTQDGVNFNLPDEGTIFRATGDQGDTVYQVSGGKLTTVASTGYKAATDLIGPNGERIAAGTTVPSGHLDELGYKPASSSYTGGWATPTNGATAYFQQYGKDFMTLPEYNIADINTVLQKTGGVWPTSNTTQTIDPKNPNGIIATNATGQVISQPNPAPQPGALTPTATNSVNPNQALTTPQVPTASSPSPAQATQPTVPIGQTPQQMQQAIQDSGQTPAPQQAPAAPYSQTNPNQVINQTTGQTAAQAATPQVNQAAAQAAVSSYTGPSIVDYLNSVGQPSDYTSRARLAAQMGIQNYSGTAAQNTQMLDTLRRGQGTPAPVVQTTTPTPPQMPSANVNANLLSQYGVKAPDPSQSPMLSFVDSYKQILSQFGLPDIKKEFDSVQKQYDDLQNDLNDKISDINDDPWLSEGVRIGRINKLKERYEGKTSILTNKLKLYDSLYQQGIDEAKWVAGQAYDQYQFDQNQQLKLYELAQKQLEAQAVDTQVVEVGGHKVLINSDTGALIKDLGSNPDKLTQADKDSAAVAAAGSSLISAKGVDGYTDPNLYARLRQSSELSPTEFDNRFGYLVNPLSRARLGLTASVASGGNNFLTPDWFKQSYTTDQLYAQAQAAGKGVGAFGNRDQAVASYLADLDKTIQAYRAAGFTDMDILKMMK